MNHILALEIELEKIREQKNASVKDMKYEIAVEIRDHEKLKENEIFTLVQNLQKVLNEIPLSPHNYSELKEISRIVYYYNDKGNPLIKRKIKAAITHLKKEKDEALLVQNFELITEFNKEIDFFETILKTM